MGTERFDAIVIGSGFGGAVAACRLAQAGLRVLILERGKRYARGGFPRKLDSFSQWMYADHGARANGLTRSLHGLIETKPLSTEMRALHAAGYGGGSLIYYNVQLRAPESVFDKGWPEGLTRKTLDPYYDLVGYMLDIAPVSEHQPLGLPPRTQQLRAAAKALGRSDQFFLPNLAVDWKEPGVLHKNKFGVVQTGCSHCGECMLGCNQHSKNTLDLNYLALAEQHGASVRTSCHVDRIERADPHGSYRVVYTELSEARKVVSVPARHVFVCAGAINTTELLLRCRDEYESLPALSSRLGHGYSANGDFLAFVFHSREPLAPTQGPGITSALLYERRSAGSEATWFLIEDGGGPEVLVRNGQVLDPQLPRHKTGRLLWDNFLRQLGAEVAASTAVQPDRSLGLLAMGKDTASGRLFLDPVTHQLRLHWEVEPNLSLYSAQARLAKDVAVALGGQAAYYPGWQLLHQPITIHNLGGCGMADSKEHGVTGPHGEVFGYPGLYVLDGAAMPRAIGSNPSHTIAAVAERSIETIIRHITKNPEWRAPERALATRIEEPMDKLHVPKGGTAAPQHHVTGLTFKETMSGFFKSGWAPADDYAGAAQAGKASGDKLEFTIDITAPDVDEFLADQDHTALASGRVHAAGFTPPEGAPVTAGVFNLFVETGSGEARKMLYALPFYGPDGSPYLLDGWKDVRDHGSFDVWAANTTLYTVIRKGHSREGEVLATGILSIDLAQVLKLMASMQVIDAANAIERAAVIERFCKAYFGVLWKVYIEPKITKLPWRSAL